jgi:two-component system chemotaxis response regulator CheB
LHPVVPHPVVPHPDKNQYTFWAAMKNTVRVIIVDDSALIRRLLTEILSSDPGIEVVAAVADPHIAREKIKELDPDVLTLDVEMPIMDGLSFLERLMRLRPMKVVMISSLTLRGAETTLRALELGAVDFIHKADLSGNLENYSEEIIQKVKSAARIDLDAMLNRIRINQALLEGSARPAVSPAHLATVVPKNPTVTGASDQQIVAIGASTGGTEAIRDVILGMPEDSPAILVTQHIPAAFSASFAARLDSLSALTIAEAWSGQTVEPGHVYIAPGGKHLLLAGNARRLYCKLDDGERVNRHKPSVDVLFRSVATVVGKRAIGVLLTGMGVDGAQGMQEMLQSGAHTIAQDESSSVVWGMPGEAVKRGAAEYTLPLGKISREITKLLRDNLEEAIKTTTTR